MARSKYIGVQAQFTNYSLMIENGDVIEESWGDESGGSFKRCQCSLCHKDLTENQYKTGKLVEYNDDESGDLALSLAHKTCVDKAKG